LAVLKLRIFDFAFVLSAAIVLTSCGSGGNGGGGSNPPPPTYTLGGNVSGLSGSGLVLQNNGGANLPVSADGSFTFPGAVTSGSAYSVNVLTQPLNPAQMCTVTNGSGTASANITNISVTCSNATTTTYTIGGTVSGLSGSGLQLQNNGSDILAVSANGGFTFGTAIASGSAYDVTVKTQPSNPAQVCSVSNGSGMATANVTTISATCTTTTNTYTIGGAVSGLSGSGLVLQNNGGDNLSVSANGSFTFATPIGTGLSYSVTVLTQPSSPSQTCTVTGGSGTVNANVTTVGITCTTNVSSYTIGGTVSGLSSGTLVLQNNGGDNLSLKANGNFTFATAIASGGDYAVTVSTQPASQFCSVTHGNGVATAKVTNVQVSCVATTGKTIPLTFFGTSFNFFTIWPPTDGDGQVATLGSLRLWDDKVKWGQINTADGKYDWTLLDSYMTMAQSMNLNVLYTFGDTPDFAGTIPTQFGVHCLAPSDYSCSPPNDVNTDGTGADKFFSDFVTALVTRYKGQISYYDLWNEPDCPCYFAGTQAQMVRMNQDAASIIRSLDSKAQILSPSGHVWTMTTWFDPYIAAGGAATFDIVNMHMRGNGDALNIVPESFLTTYANIVSDVQAQGLGNRPLWDSEHGIKADENITDPDTLAGYLAREMALRAGVGLVRQYLYSWDDSAPVGVQGTLAGTAWDTEAGWLLGHTISPCSANGTVYTCNLDDGQIVWDTAQTCSAGVCTTSNYTFPSSYVFQTDLTSKKTALSGKTVPIGYKPIFLTAN
jgi:hypothetical protein